MERSCDICGTKFTAQRATARFCSPRCRMRSSRNGGTPQPAPEVQEIPQRIIGPVEKATVAELEAVGRLETPLGQTCLVLARRLDAPRTDSGSAMAAVAGKFEAVLATAMRGTAGFKSAQLLQDELAERRVRHGA